MPSKTCFVIGTDTGIGKTLVTASLCAALVKRGVKAGAFKPVESGCSRGPRGLTRHLRRGDSLFLKKMAAMKEPLDAINPYFFREAVAPGIAAERLGSRISFSRIKQKLDALRKNYDLVFVEGAGGLLVPISGLKTNLDLIKHLKSPVLLVSRLGLGTINHTLLTLEELKRHRIRLAGVILNQTTSRTGVAEKTNPAVLKKFKVPVVGLFPFLKNRRRKTLISAVEKNLLRFLDRLA